MFSRARPSTATFIAYRCRNFAVAEFILAAVRQRGGMPSEDFAVSPEGCLAKTSQRLISCHSHGGEVRLSGEHHDKVAEASKTIPSRTRPAAELLDNQAANRTPYHRQFLITVNGLV
jgi:hypothetical protein